MAFLTVLVAFLIGQQNDRRDECEKRGGTYFSREAKCIDVREIKLP